MLGELAGREHMVVTGWAILSADADSSGDTVGYTKRKQETFNGSSNTVNTSTSFPSLRVTFSDLTKIGLITKFANSASLDFGYDHSTQNQGRQINVTTFEETSNSTDTRYSPLIGLNLNWRGNVSTTFKLDKTTRTTTNANGSQSQSVDDAITMNLRYSFRAPDGIKLPFLGGIRLSSTMNISTALSWTKARSGQKPAGAGKNADFEPRTEKSSFSVAPQAGYSFSSTLTGGFRGRWTDTNDAILDRKSHIRELGFWVEFRF